MTRLSKFLKSVVPWRIKLWIKALRDPEIATPTDLRHCYRLLLGRDPDPDGWQTFMASIRHGAMSRTRLVRDFLGSAEFSTGPLSTTTEGQEPTAVDLPEFRIYVRDTESAIGRALYHDRCYESEVTAALTQVVTLGMSVVDIGCNVGYFSLLAARLVGEGGAVYAYDPSETNCRLLRRSASENGLDNIQVHCKALANGVSQYAYIEGDGNGVLQHLNLDGPATCGAVVTTASLDAELPDTFKPNLIKLDVEGAEHLVLNGARRILKNHAPVILSEFSPKALEQVSRIAPRTYVEDILGLGYRVFVLDPTSAPIALGAGSQAVIDYWRRRKTDHIDLMFVPTGHGRTWTSGAIAHGSDG